MPGGHKKKKERKKEKLAMCHLECEPLTFRVFMRQEIFLFLCIHGIHKRRLDGLSSMSFLHHDIQDCSIMS